MSGYTVEIQGANFIKRPLTPSSSEEGENKANPPLFLKRGLGELNALFRILSCK